MIIYFFFYCRRLFSLVMRVVRHDCIELYHMCIIPAMRAKCHWCEDAGQSCSPWEWLSVPASCPSTPSSLPSCLTLPRLQPQKSSHLLGLSRLDFIILMSIGIATFTTENLAQYQSSRLLIVLYVLQ